MIRSIKEIIDTAMIKTALILKEKAEKRMKYNKRVKNRERLNKKK